MFNQRRPHFSAALDLKEEKCRHCFRTAPCFCFRPLLDIISTEQKAMCTTRYVLACFFIMAFGISYSDLVQLTSRYLGDVRKLVPCCRQTAFSVLICFLGSTSYSYEHRCHVSCVE